MEFENYEYFHEEDDEMNVGEEHQRWVVIKLNMRLHLRDIANPFAISVSEFTNLYRLDQHRTMQVVQIVAPYMAIRVNAHHVPTEIKVLCALLFYASGSYQRVVGRASDLSVSQTSISSIIDEVTRALNHRNVLTRFIHFPATHLERETTIQRNSVLGMPRVLGFVDGTLVKIVPPPMFENQEA